MARKGQKKAKISPQRWARLRSEFESGKYHSIEDFYERYVECQKNVKKTPFPTLVTIRRQAVNKKWSKHANEADIAEEEKRLTIEMYGKLGLPPRRAAQALADGVLHAERTEEKILALIKETGQDGVTLERLTALMNLCKGYISDMRTAAVYLDQYHKVTGAYAPTKHQHTGKIGVEEQPYSELTTAQRQKEIERRLERLKKLRADLAKA